VLTFHGRNIRCRSRPELWLTFGASETRFHGTVSNISRPSDVAGVYGQAGSAPRRAAARKAWC